jgi:hypothetical protein
MSYPVTTPVSFENVTGASINFNSNITNNTNSITNFVSTSGGDMLYRAPGANNTLTRLPIGNESLALRSIGGIPSWGIVSSTGAVTFQSFNALKNGTAQGGITTTPTTITGWDLTTAPAYDNLNTAFNITTGVFTAPATGSYYIKANIFISQSANNGTSRNIEITKNGTPIELVQSPPPASTAVNYSYQIGKTTQCNSGDTLSVRVYRVAGSATLTIPAYAIGTAATNLSIVRLS